ncbi:hypothetical protein [Thauera propionica]|uniref:hypothetical protein n=1 Tax=Thauera propionica TaxID=2019431 RepID=UPI0023F410A7|nr:hypothetical protein [Thauera propionica]MDD3676380.1 hypothetical protein [Thauera propionica]
MESRLFRVYMRTKDHELVRELIVTATNEAEARERAIHHVKDANKKKGKRTKKTSEDLTKILAIVPTSKPHCLRVSEMPAAAVRQLIKSLTT